MSRQGPGRGTGRSRERKGRRPRRSVCAAVAETVAATVMAVTARTGAKLAAARTEATTVALSTATTLPARLRARLPSPLPLLLASALNKGHRRRVVMPAARAHIASWHLQQQQSRRRHGRRGGCPRRASPLRVGWRRWRSAARRVRCLWGTRGQRRRIDGYTRCRDRPSECTLPLCIVFRHAGRARGGGGCARAKRGGRCEGGPSRPERGAADGVLG